MTDDRPILGQPDTKRLCGVILAGGRSRRMGRDKAWLEIEGQPLLLRQIRLLQEVGLSEIGIAAGPADRPPLPSIPPEIPLLRDRFDGLGPLAGLEAGLGWSCSRNPMGWTLAVAVDLPGLSSEWLRRLLAQARPGMGCVPVHEGRLEPLAALYPNLAWPIAREHLEKRQASVQEFCRRGLEAGWMTSWELAPEDHRTLINWNAPSDWPPQRPDGRGAPGVNP